MESDPISKLGGLGVFVTILVSCIRGFHVYKDVWNPVVGETLNAEREKKPNPIDKYAVSLMKDGNIVGHVPWKISKTAAFFLKHGGTLQCTVTEKHPWSGDLDMVD